MKIVAVLAALVLLSAAALSALPLRGEDAVYDSVIRLHVIAESDSEKDQADKLAVRDAILPLAARELAECESRDSAAVRLRDLMPALEKAAEDVLRERGCERDVSVALGQEDYPTRDYEGFCFPAGEYLSLRVMIGKAEGRNWWCVLFPSLCLSVADGGSAERLEEAFVAVGLTPEQYRVITESDENTTYRLRFKVLEILEAWRRGER